MGSEYDRKSQVGYKAASLLLLIWGTQSLGEAPSGGASLFCLLFLAFEKK